MFFPFQHPFLVIWKNVCALRNFRTLSQQRPQSLLPIFDVDIVPQFLAIKGV